MSSLVQRLSFRCMIPEILLRHNANNAQKLSLQQSSSPQHPKNDDREGWRNYLLRLGQTWRIEPEIDAKRQQYLAERRAIVPDIEKGIYRFKSVKLNRADVEWLLTTHENGRGPVDWSDDHQRECIVYNMSYI